MSQAATIEVHDSVVMGDLTQNIRTDRLCSACGTTNAVVMVCQREGCSEVFCEVCHRDCKVNLPIYNPQVEAEAWHSQLSKRGEDWGPDAPLATLTSVTPARVLSFDHSSGDGPYCETCISTLIERKSDLIRETRALHRQFIEEDLASNGSEVKMAGTRLTNQAQVDALIAKHELEDLELEFDEMMFPVRLRKKSTVVSDLILIGALTIMLGVGFLIGLFF